MWKADEGRHVKVQVVTPGFSDRIIIRKVHCSRRCGWYRPYQDSVRWQQRHIDHPMWGHVTNEVAAQNDIYHHNCNEYKQAVNRARKLFGKPRDYEGRSHG